MGSILKLILFCELLCFFIIENVYMPFLLKVRFKKIRFCFLFLYLFRPPFKDV